MTPRHRLILDCLPMVRELARRHARTGLGYEDAYGAGCVAVCEAAERYDPAYGWSFWAFAQARVRGAIADAARNLHGSKRYLNAVDPVGDGVWDFPAPEDTNALGICALLGDCAETDRWVAVMVAAGYRRTDIAASMGVSESRVSQRLNVVMRNMKGAAA